MIRTGLYLVALAFAIIGLIWLMAPDTASPSATHEREAVPLDRTPTNSAAAVTPNPTQKNPTGLKHLSNELTPADVMGNLYCRMKPGAMNARDLAVIVVPGQNGSRFAAVDRSGVVFGDSLPFPATVEQFSVARRTDGSVVAGFGGLDVHGAGHAGGGLRQRIGLRGPAMRGVVVYQDRQIIYESREATGFGLGDDGSSFYVLEPMAGNGTLLVIQNLDLGVGFDHDLSTLLAHPDTNAHSIEYSLDQSEVVVGTPDTSSVPRSHYAEARWQNSSHDHLEFRFFPADGGEPRKLTDYRGFPTFVSSNEAYFALPRGRGLATVKREYSYEGGEVSAVEERWSRDLRPGPVAGDGAWLVAVNYDVFNMKPQTTEAHILDPSTGDTLYVHRWSPPVNHWWRIHDGRLALGHSVHERGYRTVYDVYDVRTLADGSAPNHYQVETRAHSYCGSGDDPFGKLEVRDGQLTYVPRK